jgi:hypothetical protein
MIFFRETNSTKVKENAPSVPISCPDFPDFPRSHDGHGVLDSFRFARHPTKIVGEDS